MPQLKWKDSSSYSQGEKREGPPKGFRATAGRFELIVTRVHLHNPGRWTLHIYPGLYDTFDMQMAADSPNGAMYAQKLAEDLLRDRLREALAALTEKP